MCSAISSASHLAIQAELAKVFFLVRKMEIAHSLYMRRSFGNVVRSSTKRARAFICIVAADSCASSVRDS